jgi:alpha-L-rhamnosidase
MDKSARLPSDNGYFPPWIIGESRISKESQRYQKSTASPRKEFVNEYITTSGRVVSDSQTSLALAIHFSLFATPQQERLAAERLRFIIRNKSRFKIAIGFAGTPILGHALTKSGMSQLFYRMLLHKKNPSWLYPVTMGATTVWERWDSMLLDGSINPRGMTSFNHYAIGPIADSFLLTPTAAFSPTVSCE